MKRIIVLVFLAAAACQSSASTTASSAPPASQTAATGIAASPPAPAPSAPGVAAALSAAPGTPVSAVGLYLGYKGPCMGSPPTRSAWMLADSEQKGAACLYVDGPAVPGVSPNAALGKNIRVRVQGVLRDEGGQKYIEARKVDRQ